MKPILGIRSKLLSYSLAAILLGSASFNSAASDPNDAVVQTVGSVSYVSGGVGTESLDKLSAMARDFNLKLVFALKSGSFMTGVRVVITDAKGKAILDTTSEGPWFLTKLPAGNYQVVATLSGKAEKRQVAVGAKNLRTIDFRWDSE